MRGQACEIPTTCYIVFIYDIVTPMPYDPARHGAYVDAYDHHRQQNPQRANDWIDKLKRDFYDRGNSVGTEALYSAIQKRHPAPNAYPTKRFVRAWLRRQATVQVHQRHKQTERVNSGRLHVFLPPSDRRTLVC